MRSVFSDSILSGFPSVSRTFCPSLCFGLSSCSLVRLFKNKALVCPVAGDRQGRLGLIMGVN